MTSGQEWAIVWCVGIPVVSYWSYRMFGSKEQRQFARRQRQELAWTRVLRRRQLENQRRVERGLPTIDPFRHELWEKWEEKWEEER